MGQPKKRCVFLSCADLSEFVHDDYLATPYFEQAGWSVETVAWDDAHFDWTKIDEVVLRTTWDYTSRLNDFLAVLKSIEQAGPRIWNGMNLVHWNARKTYLLELENHGVRIVPTLYSAGVQSHAKVFSDAKIKFATSDFILKPIVGAGAKGIERFSREGCSSLSDRHEPLFIQPFMPEVQSEGEYSLIYFGMNFSHAILKKPKSGDFRSQEEYKSTLTAIRPEASLVSACEKVLDVLPEVPLYSRLDFVMNADRQPCLMEVELIEPALYFRCSSGSEKNFVTEFLRRVS